MSKPTPEEREQLEYQYRRREDRVRANLQSIAMHAVALQADESVSLIARSTSLSVDISDMDYELDMIRDDVFGGSVE